MHNVANNSLNIEMRGRDSWILDLSQICRNICEKRGIGKAPAFQRVSVVIRHPGTDIKERFENEIAYLQHAYVFLLLPKFAVL